MAFARRIDMNEIIDMYINGEYSVVETPYISDIDYYFNNLDYFNITSDCTNV